MPILTRMVVLADQLVKPTGIHERQPAQVQDDVAHSPCVRRETVEHLGDLGGGRKVQLTPERDQCRTTVSSRLNFKQVIGFGAAV